MLQYTEVRKPSGAGQGYEDCSQEVANLSYLFLIAYFSDMQFCEFLEE